MAKTNIKLSAPPVKGGDAYHASERAALFGILHEDYRDLSGVQYAMALDACLNIAYSLDTCVRRFSKIVNAGPDLDAMTLTGDEVKAFSDGIVGRMTARVAEVRHD